MAAADTAKLIASLELRDRLSPGIKSANKSLGSLENRAYRVGRNIGTGIANAGKIAAVGIAALASQVAFGLDSLIELEKSEAQTGAVLKSTGQAAGINGAQVTALAEKYENLNATIGDEFIRAGENMLLTFTNIKGKAFEPALEAVLNLNTAMGKGPEGLTKTAILVGKALNDPTKGLTALTRVGVTFSKKQIERIKSLQKEGKLYEAQQVVLGELNKEFGGSFLAQGGTTAGKVAKFHDAIEDLQRSLATALLPTVSHVADALGDFLADPAVLKGAEDLGREMGQLFSRDNLEKAGRAISDVFTAVKGALPGVKSALQTVAGVVKGAVDAFKSLPPELQKLVIGGLAVEKLTGGLVTNLAGGLISAVLKQLVSGVVNVNGGVVNVNGAGVGAGKGGIPPIAGAGAGGLAAFGGPLAIAAAIQVGTSVGADLFNKELAKSGINANFTGGPAGPGSIIPAIQNLGEVFKLYTGQTTKEVQIARAREVEAASRTTTAVENMKALMGTKLEGVKSTSIQAGLAAKNAAGRTTAAVNSVQRAIDRKQSTVIVNVRNSIREQANAVSSRSTHKIL